MSKAIPVDELEDGMILAEPVINQFHQTLMSSGNVLEARHKKLLKTWNIRVVTVKVNENETQSELSEAMIALAKDRLSKRLLWEPTNEIEQDLFQISIKQAANLILTNKSKINSDLNINKE